MSRVRLLTLLVVGLAVSAGNADSLATLRAGRQMALHEVAGKVDWSRIPQQGGFVQTELPFVPSTRTTSVQTVHDGAFLRVRMTMEEPRPELLKGREKFGIWQNDTAEVLLQVPGQESRSAFWHMAVDSAGHLFVSEDRPIPEEPGSYFSEAKTDSGITATAEVTADGWIATFAVPSSVPTKPVKANFCRQTREPYGFSSWSLTKKFQDFTRFGELVPDAAADNGAVYQRALAAFQSERASTLGRFKARSYDWKWAFGACEGYRPLAAGYSSASGYGWIKPVMPGQTSEDRRTRRPKNQALSELADNFVGGTDANEFRVDLPDGKYKVHLAAGLIAHESKAHRRLFAVTANGRKVNDFYVGDGHFCLWDFPVEVKEGKLELGFEPHEVVDRPATAKLGTAASCMVKGFAVNSIVVYPIADRKAALKQIKTDELEIRLGPPTELVNWNYVEPHDPEPAFAPTAAAAARGWTVFSKPLGANIFAGSRPATPEEAADVLKVRAAPGEKFQISFGVLPLREAEGEEWTTTGFPLRIREAMQMPWRIGDGRYAYEPYQLEEAAFVDRDLDRGVTRNLWLTGTVPDDAEPGVIRASFAIGKDAVPVEIEVLPIRLEPVDFAWGGYHPDGYARPACYEDVVARACQDVGMNAFVFYAHPERIRKGSFERLKARVRLYQSLGIRGKYAVLCLLDENEGRLRAKKIDALPQQTIDDQIVLARQIAALSSEIPGAPEFYYTAMDEAHCKGDPYWAEQVRLFRAIKENVPGIETFASESERSYRRCGRYLDVPNLFEVPDFTRIQGFRKVWSYPNQAMLKCGDNDNAGRFCTGLLPEISPLRGVLPWMIMHGHANSTFATDPWEMLTVRGIGGFRVIPRKVTVLAEVGTWDMRYFATLHKLIDTAAKGSPAARREAVRQQMILDMVKEGTRPSYMYYYNNGYFPAETFCTLREKVTDGILRLQELLK